MYRYIGTIHIGNMMFVNFLKIYTRLIGTIFTFSYAPILLFLPVLIAAAAVCSLEI